MADAGVRIALLAKAGESRNQLRAALQDLGANLVCEGDPGELNPASVSELEPKVMVVSLEPSIESALAKFDDLLDSSAIEVVYDDAEVSGQLSGWDLNRWARHLAAKIIGADLLPPVPEGAERVTHDEWQPKPGAPETPAQAMSEAKLEDYLHATHALATDVPVNESYSDALQRAVPEPPSEPESDAMLDFNLGDLEQAMRLDMAEGQHHEVPEKKVELETRSATVDEHALAEFSGFMAEDTVVAEDDGEFIVAAAANSDNGSDEIVEHEFIAIDDAQGEIADEINLGSDADFNIDLSALENSEETAADTSSLSFEETASSLADFEMSDNAVSFSQYQSEDVGEVNASLDDDVAAMSAQLDEFEKNDSRAVAKNMDFGSLEEATEKSRPVGEVAGASNFSSESTASATTSEMPKFDAASLSLVDVDAVIAVEKSAQVVTAATALLKRNKFTLEAIEGEEPAEKPLSDIGAVLILAGMGGPDAVRQLLKALPATLNVPVLLYQHLEVGKHDRLVAQLQKISSMPIYLAVQGQTAEPGKVAVLPSGIGLDLVEHELFFGGAESQQALVESLPAQHSVVIVLSGAASETAAAAVSVQNKGGLALAQDPTNCFEPTAAEALVNQGGKTAEISALATMVVEYFKH